MCSSYCSESLPHPLYILGVLLLSSLPGTLALSLTCSVHIDLQSKLTKWKQAAHLWPRWARCVYNQSKRQDSGERWELALWVKPEWDNVAANLQKPKCEHNRGKLTWRGFPLMSPLSKTNLNKWANMCLTWLASEENLICRILKMTKTVSFFFLLLNGEHWDYYKTDWLCVTGFSSGTKAGQLVSFNIPWQ